MELAGIGIGQGIGIGVAARMPERLAPPSSDAFAGDAGAERARVEAALADVAEELGARAAGADGAARDVLEAQAMMAGDPALRDEIRTRIEAGRSGEQAVVEAIAGFREMLSAAGGYLAERAADLEDVAQRTIARLRGVPAPDLPVREAPFVLVARDLAPADTAQLDADTVVAIVTSEGGPSSHTAIIARDRGIPAVVGVAGAEELRDGVRLIVDAGAGRVIADASEAELDAARARRDALAAAADAPIEPGQLADGTRIPILANLGEPREAARAVELGAEGVGLFRTEFLFLDAATAPSVAEQTGAYRELLAAFPGQRVVVRVLDAGADKPLAFLASGDEPNPALGVRGLRALREHEEVLRGQLEALAAADAETDAELWVMAPMVADAADSAYFTARARELGVRVAGSMIEIPSAAICCEQVLETSDFASIGTNDLTQYALAADRQLGAVAAMQDPWHPAVLRLIRMAGEAGAQAGKPIGVCGEAAADPALAVVLVGLGVTSLSMSPTAFAAVRAALREVSLDEARARADRACAAASPAAARAAASA